MAEACPRPVPVVLPSGTATGPHQTPPRKEPAVTALDDMLDQLSAVSVQSIRNELARLRAIEKWAHTSLNLDFVPGDRVVIVSEHPSLVGLGWESYSEALRPGQTGIAGDVSFNEYANRWQVLVGLDRAWSTSEVGWNPPTIERHWRGPHALTPDGFKVYSSSDQAGSIKYFALDADWVVRAASDEPGPQQLAVAAEGAGA